MSDSSVPLDQYKRAIIHWAINVIKSLLMRIQRMKLNGNSLLPIDQDVILNMEDNLDKKDFLEKKNGSKLLACIQFGETKLSDELEGFLCYLRECVTRLALYFVPREPVLSNQPCGLGAVEAYLVQEKCLLAIKKTTDYYASTMIPQHDPAFKKFEAIIIIVDCCYNFDKHLSVKEMSYIWQNVDNAPTVQEGKQEKKTFDDADCCYQTDDDDDDDDDDEDKDEDEGNEEEKKNLDEKLCFNQGNGMGKSVAKKVGHHGIHSSVQEAPVCHLKQHHAVEKEKSSLTINKAEELAAVVGQLVGDKEAVVAQCLGRIGAFKTMNRDDKNRKATRAVSSPPVGH